MHITEQIEYFIASSHFAEAEIRGLKLQQGHIETNLWLHKEKINLDQVIETAKNFSDSKTFIISSGVNKGFYIYSSTQKKCYKLVDKSQQFEHAESA